MFIHNKDLQFEVRVSAPDPRFATLLQEQFGGANGELKAAMQYFTQAFLLRGKNPKMYDLFMDIATEELSHLEMVGSMITMLLDGLNDDLKLANERCDWMPAVVTTDGRDRSSTAVRHQPAVLRAHRRWPRRQQLARVCRGAGRTSTPTATRRWTCAATWPPSHAPRSSTSTSSSSPTTRCAGHPDVPDDPRSCALPAVHGCDKQLPVNFPRATWPATSASRSGVQHVQQRR